jgi:hypothetical protein
MVDLGQRIKIQLEMVGHKDEKLNRFDTVYSDS